MSKNELPAYDDNATCAKCGCKEIYTNVYPDDGFAHSHCVSCGNGWLVALMTCWAFRCPVDPFAEKETKG